jgi:hypothetical protein
MKKDDEDDMWDFMDDDYVPTPKQKRRQRLNAIRFFFVHLGESLYGVPKYWLTKLFHHGIAPIDLWNLDGTICKWLLPRLQAFIKMERQGYPHYYSEWSDDCGWCKSKAEYDELIAKGEIKGGGPEAWERDLKEIEFALRWKVECDFGTTKKRDKFYADYGYANPHTKCEENKSISYVYR